MAQRRYGPGQHCCDNRPSRSKMESREQRLELAAVRAPVYIY